MNENISTLVGPDGTLVIKQNVPMSVEDHQLLLQYRKFLLRQGLREALFCNDCFEGNRNEGTRAHVTDSSVLIECRCKTRSRAGFAVTS